ncbi:VIT1/CCC1 transporter family protein [Candidatus Woesearchaeota archaeon]|nr:VIT1/CCC1 transporter family protein [Candidatus Woesearchaeota archaeon]
MEKKNNSLGSQFRDIILGGQDGVVNVLGVVLAIAAATNETRVIIIAGIAANLAESLSMAAVAYTSTKAYNQYYYSERERERREIKEIPNEERREIYKIYQRKGFRGKLLDQIVTKITSSKRLWLETMMTEELNLSTRQIGGPIHSAFVVGISSIIGSTIPLLPFFFVSVQMGILISLVASTIALFLTGAIKAKFTIGSWLKNGLEMAIIGIVTALVGYGIGAVLGQVF